MCAPQTARTRSLSVGPIDPSAIVIRSASRPVMRAPSAAITPSLPEGAISVTVLGPPSVRAPVGTASAQRSNRITKSV